MTNPDQQHDREDPVVPMMLTPTGADIAAEGKCADEQGRRFPRKHNRAAC